MNTASSNATLGRTFDDRSTALALAIVVQRIGSLPKRDRDDLFDLLMEWRSATDPEDQAGICFAMEEILTQKPITAEALPLTEEPPLSRGLKAWSEHVGQKIRELRERATWTQAHLAEKAGLTQSHISRLENAEHSATNFTLEKIAKAFGVSVRDIDPCLD